MLDTMPLGWVALFIISVVLFIIIYIYLVMRHGEKVQVLQIASWIALGIAFFMIMHVIFLMVYPTKIQEVDQPMKILNPNYEVRRGEPLTIQYHIRKYAALPSTLYPAILCTNGVYMTFPSRVSNVPVGEGTFIVNTPYVIPDWVPLNSNCKISTTDIFTVNVLRQKIYKLESENFTIIK
jgi:hypothetical protein